jgi:Tfp pilus assembly protein PilF
MKNITLAIVVLALVMGSASLAVADPDPAVGNPDLKSMTAAQLEKDADSFRAQKNYILASEYLRAAIKKDRSNSILYNKLGISEMQRGELRGAKTEFQNALKKNPKFAEAMNNVGVIDLMQKKFGSATKNFKKAIALQETNATFHVNLGAAWLGQNKLERAASEYTRAIELDPEVLARSSRNGISAQLSTPEEKAKVDFLLARIFASRGDVDRCLQCLQKAKEGGYGKLADVYKDEQFARLWQDQRLAQIVPPPAK